MTPHSESPWLSTEAVAARTGHPVKTVSAWRYRKVGPPGYKVGRHVRYHVDEVDAWMRGSSDGR